MRKYLFRTIMVALLLVGCWFAIAQWLRSMAWEDAAVTGTSGAAQLLSHYGNYWATHRSWPPPDVIRVPRWQFLRRNLGGSIQEDIYYHVSEGDSHLIVAVKMSPDGRTETHVELATTHQIANATPSGTQPASMPIPENTKEQAERNRSEGDASAPVLKSEGERKGCVTMF